MTTSSDPVLQALHERRSIRKFTDEPVSRENMETVLDAGRWAPSGLNNQPWKFLVIWPDDPRRDKLADCTKYAPIVKNAQALIAVFLDEEKTYHPMKDHQAAGAAIQNMLLAIHALGLGAVWLGEIVNQAEQVLETLSLDGSRYSFMAMLAVGYPAAPGASSRRPLEDFMLEEI